MCCRRRLQIQRQLRKFNRWQSQLSVILWLEEYEHTFASGPEMTKFYLPAAVFSSSSIADFSDS